MNAPLTTVSFFSGAGGLDIGFARAGWSVVAFSEISPYAIACFRSAHPDATPLGSITDLVGHPDKQHGPSRVLDAVADGRVPAADWRDATLWTGGFPCQDLSVAGKRRGLDGDRSGLAFAFVELVERHRPPWFLLENVPGLLSSNGGDDLLTLQRLVAGLGYGMARRVLDAQYFGVAQRRRRLFLLATRDPGGRAGAERAASVLHQAAHGGGHPAALREARTESSDRFADGVGAHGVLPQAITAKWAKQSSGPAGDEYHNLIVGTLQAPAQGGWRGDADSAGAGHLIAYGRTARAHSTDYDNDGDHWDEAAIANTLNRFDLGEARANELIPFYDLAGTLTAPDVSAQPKNGKRQDGTRYDRSPLAPAVVPGSSPDSGGVRTAARLAGRLHDSEPDLLPEGFDSARYTVIGNGVAAPCAQYIAWSLRAELEGRA